MRLTGCPRFVTPRSSCDVRGVARAGRAVGRWSLPRPPRPWPVAGLALEGAAPHPPVRSPKGPSVRTSSPSLLSGAVPIALANVYRPSLLGSVRTSEHACSEMRLSPLHRRACEASTPATTASRRFGLEGSTPEVPFRPRGFSPPRRLPPLHELRACCIPLPILGSTAFPLLVSRSEDRDAPQLPRSAGPYPSKESSPTAGTRHRVRCPLAVPCPITASPRLVPLPVPGPSGWEDRERRLRGLAPSSSLVWSPAVAGG